MRSTAVLIVSLQKGLFNFECDSIYLMHSQICPTHPLSHTIVLRCFPNTPLMLNTMHKDILPKISPIFRAIICVDTFQLALDSVMIWQDSNL